MLSSLWVPKTTSPAQEPTAGSAAAARPARLPSPPRPPAGSTAPTPVAHRGDLAVRHVGADLALAAVHELLDLRHERIDQPRPRGPGQRVPARVPDRHI